MVDLTATYDTVWHQGLVLKLLQKIPDRRMAHFATNILANHTFVVKTSDGNCRNGVPQGSCLSPILFNIYISDIPKTKSRQYGYSDDLALLHMVEEELTADMALISKYLRL